MCMKYEDKYKGLCFDTLWESYMEGDTDIVNILENDGQIKFVNKQICKDEFKLPSNAR